MTVDLPWHMLQRTLATGGIVVVWVEAPTEIEAMRQLTRWVCTELTARLSIDGLHVSRSATPGLGAVALCASAAVGVDVERQRTAWVEDDLLRLALHPAEFSEQRRTGEEAFFGIWVRKEAVLKALGVGLATAPSTFAVGKANTEWMTCSVTNIGTVRLRSLSAPKGFDAAIACSGRSNALQCWSLRTAGCTDNRASLTSVPNGASGHTASVG